MNGRSEGMFTRIFCGYQAQSNDFELRIEVSMLESLQNYGITNKLFILLLETYVPWVLITSCGDFHRAAFARLPVIGAYEDWKDCTRLAVRMEW